MESNSVITLSKGQLLWVFSRIQDAGRSLDEALEELQALEDHINSQDPTSIEEAYRDLEEDEGDPCGWIHGVGALERGEET